MICIHFSKGFFWSHLKTFAELQAKRHENILKIIKRSRSSLIQFYVWTWLVKNENETISLPCSPSFIFVNGCTDSSGKKSTQIQLCCYSSCWYCTVASEETRDTWCTGSKAQFAAFDFSILLELPLGHPAGRGKERGVCRIKCLVGSRLASSEPRLHQQVQKQRSALPSRDERPTSFFVHEKREHPGGERGWVSNVRRF